MALPQFTVNNWLNQIHDFHRWNVVDGMKEAPNTFDPDFNGSGKGYLQGVGSVAGVYFALAVLFFLSFMITFFVGCCCRKAPARFLPKQGCCRKLCSNLFGPRPWMIGAIVIMIAMACAAISNQGIIKVRNGITDFNSDLTALSNQMTIADKSVTQNLLPGLTTFSTAINSLSSAAATNNAPAGVISALNTMSSQAQDAVSAANSAHNALASTIDIVVNKIQNGDVNADVIGKKFYTGGTIVLAVFIAWLVMVVFTLIPTKCCATVFRSCVPLVLFGLLLAWIFAGFFLGGSLVGSDICVAPSQGVTKIANLVNAGPMATSSLNYYTSCGVAGQVVAPAGAYAEVTNAQAQLVLAQGQAAIVSAGLLAAPWAQPFLGNLNAGLAAANVGMLSVEDASDCDAFYPQYVALIDDLCNSGIVGSAVVFALSTVAAIAFFVMAIASARLCFRHPGDPVTPGGEKDLRLPTANPYGHESAVGPAVHGATPGYAYAAGSAAAYQDWRA